MRHKNTCQYVDRQTKAAVEMDLLTQNPGSTSAGPGLVQRSDLAGLRWTPQIPPEYAMAYSHSQPSTSRSPSVAPSISSSHTVLKESPSIGDFNLIMGPPADPIQRQKEFNSDIIRMICSCEMSFYILERPEFRHFILKWISGVRLPDRHTASGSVLQAEAERVVSETRKRVEGKYACYQADGWKNVAKTSVVSSMILVDHQVSAFCGCKCTGA